MHRNVDLSDVSVSLLDAHIEHNAFPWLHLCHDTPWGISVVLLHFFPDVHHGGHKCLRATLVIDHVVAVECHVGGDGCGTARRRLLVPAGLKEHSALFRVADQR